MPATTSEADPISGGRRARSRRSLRSAGVVAITVLSIAGCGSSDETGTRAAPSTLSSTTSTALEPFESVPLPSTSPTTSSTSVSPTSSLVGTPLPGRFSGQPAEWEAEGYLYGLTVGLNTIPAWVTSVDGLPAGKVKLGAESHARGWVTVRNGFDDRALPAITISLAVEGFYPQEVCAFSSFFKRVTLGGAPYCAITLGAVKFDRLGLGPGEESVGAIGTPGPPGVNSFNEGAEADSALALLSAPPQFVGVSRLHDTGYSGGLPGTSCEGGEAAPGFYGVWSLDGTLVSCPGGLR